MPCPPLTRAAVDPRLNATSRKNTRAIVSVQQYVRWNVGTTILVSFVFAVANNSPYVMKRTSKRESEVDKPGHSSRNARGGKGTDGTDGVSSFVPRGRSIVSDSIVSIVSVELRDLRKSRVAYAP